MSDPLSGPPQELCEPLSDPQVKPLTSLVLEGFLRREQLAQQFGFSPRTIDPWEALRKGPPRVCVGRTILYKIQSVREWLSSQEQQPFATRKRRNFSKVKPWLGPG
jgi:predicted DNA-binding transcriptional regulator AlpA